MKSHFLHEYSFNKPLLLLSLSLLPVLLLLLLLLLGIIILFFLYNIQIEAHALIGQSAVGYCAGKPTEKSRVFWIII